MTTKLNNYIKKKKKMWQCFNTKNVMSANILFRNFLISEGM